MTEIRYGWHFLDGEGRPAWGGLGPVEVGRTYRVKGTIEVCVNGLHGSLDPLVSMSYAPRSSGCVVTWCEYSGPFSDNQDGKFAARTRRVLAMADATREIHEFAAWCIRRALLRERREGREPDPRSWEALRVKAQWLRGKATDAELARAAEAAGAAAAAWGVAVAAAPCPAYAAGAAAWAAAYERTRRAAERIAQRRRLTAVLNRALGIT